ncbi:MAG: hypothetical protein SVP52_07005 [Chloroflexota bacterium]|nr:hypothetical protein [Chloroflexota bacterium]
MILSACNSQPGNPSSTQTAILTLGLTRVETYPEPTPSVPTILSATSTSSSDEINATEPAVLEIPYTEAHPLTDADEIQEILDRLQEREVSWFSRPGWYRFTTDYPLGGDYTKMRYALTHVINENRDCREQFSYYEKDGVILPYSIRLDDGSFGLLHHTTDGEFQVVNALPSGEASPCDLGNGYSLALGTTDGNFFLHDEAAQFRKSSNAIVEGIQTNFRVWVEEYDTKQTLVLVYDVTIEYPSLRGSVLDPTTGIFSTIVRSIRFHYIELETGLQVRFDEAFYLESGKLVDADGVGLLYSYEYLETIPELIKESYEDVAVELRALLDQAKNNNP